MKRIYMDNAAATPVDSCVEKAMNVVTKKYYANPSALHMEGKEARATLEAARAKVAGILSAHPDEIIFTSGATEANNLALQGVVRAAHARGIARPHIIISAIEHPSVLETARSIAGEGVRVEILPVDSCGLVSPREFRKLITPETVLVSVMYANNEIGTIEPIREIAKEVRHARKMYKSVYPYFHTDAAQAANYLDINVARLGVDLMTLSSGKTYGPRGIGALFVRRGVNLVPLMYGGEHERGRRPGTESVALAHGFAEALAFAEKIKAKESARVKKLRDALAEKILKKISGTRINGSLEVRNSTLARHCEARSRAYWQAGNLEPIDCHVGELANSLLGSLPPRNDGKQSLVIQGEYSLPNILSISFEGVDSEALILYLDAAGISISGGSACKSGTSEKSHVILAIGKDDTGVVRFSLGRETKKEDIARVVKELERIVPLLREARTQSDII